MATKTYCADVFNHKSELVVRYEADTWPVVWEFVENEIPEKDIDAGFTIVVWIKRNG